MCILKVRRRSFDKVGHDLIFGSRKDDKREVPETQISSLRRPKIKSWPPPKSFYSTAQIQKEE